MTRRMTLGLFAVATAGLIATATTLAFGHGGRHGFMKRVITAHIDEALDQASATPEQRAAVYAARDRALGAWEAHRQTRTGRMQEVLTMFEADYLDPQQVQAYRQAREEEHRRIADAMSQAAMEVHQALTPAQRKIVADYVRSHRRHAAH
jgi:protein CpxP